MEIRRISTEECMPLRSKVLRPFHPLEDCRYPLDHEAVHFGAVEDGKIVSIITAHPEDHKKFQEKGMWRIRGMATDPSAQGKGYGGEVLKAMIAWKRGPLWCNAREKAIPFYLRHGFTIQSELFDIPGIGPHKILKRVP